MMTIRDWLDDKADQEELELLVMDGFDDCIIGVVEECGQDPKVVYDRVLVIEQLAQEMEGDDAWADAWDFHNFNQTSQPGVVFLDRPGPLDGVIIADPEEIAPWWLEPVRTGIVIGVSAGIVITAAITIGTLARVIGIPIY